MSKVRRPSRNALAWLVSSVTNAPTAGSGNGACQPPCVKAPRGSSSGPPGACITPSRVRNVWTVSFMPVQTNQRTDSERISRRIASRESTSCWRAAGLLARQFFPRLAAAHAPWLLGNDVRPRSRMIITGLDQDPAVLAGTGQGESPGELAAVQNDGQVVRLIADDLG